MTYELIRSGRKAIALQIKDDGRIIVRAPLRMSARDIQRFVDSKAAWIEKHIVIIQQRQQPTAPAFTMEHLQHLANAAKSDIAHRAARFAGLIGVTCGRITTRAQKRRWGSCAGKGRVIRYGVFLLHWLTLRNKEIRTRFQPESGSDLSCMVDDDEHKHGTVTVGRDAVTGGEGLAVHGQGIGGEGAFVHGFLAFRPCRPCFISCGML